MIVTKERAHNIQNAEYDERRRKLEVEGANIVEVQESQGLLSIPSLIAKLRESGVRSLMVEGGATVISSFLNSGMVDNLIVTVAPTVVGHQGIGYEVKGEGKVPRLEYLRSEPLGRDTVMAWKLLRSQPG